MACSTIMSKYSHRNSRDYCEMMIQINRSSNESSNYMPKCLTSLGSTLGLQPNGPVKLKEFFPLLGGVPQS